MGKPGDGYGSEYHLRRLLKGNPAVIDERIAANLGIDPKTITWLASPLTRAGGEGEYQGMGFLRGTSHEDVLVEWSKFWPKTGRQQTWDAVGKAGDEWLLVEAKANWPEFCSPPTTAKKEGGLPDIKRAFGMVQRDLNVHRFFSWTGTYYQYANRLATLWFLRKHDVPAKLVFVYFTGDVFPDATPCVTSEQEWDDLIEARRLTLGLPTHHALTPDELHITIPATI